MDPAVAPHPAIGQVLPVGATDSRLEVESGTIHPESKPRTEFTDGNSRTRRMLVASDLSALVLAFAAGLLAAGSSDPPGERNDLIIVLGFSLPLWVLGAYAANLYHDFEQRIDRNFVDESGRIIVISMAWSWLFMMLLTFWTDNVDLIATSVFVWLFASPLLIIGRAAVRLYVSRQPWNLQPVALIGDQAGLASLRDRIERHPEWRLDVKIEIMASNLAARKRKGWRAG